MARLPRLALAQQAHLVLLPGQQGRNVFEGDTDRLAFLAALREAAMQHRVAVEAYSLATDAVYLLLRPAEGPALGALMQGLGRRYVAQFNRRHGRSGSVWAGRYRAALLQPGPWTLQAMCFVDQHNHQQGRVAEPRADTWCSAPHHLGLRRDPLITDGPAWWALGNTPFEREAAYRRLMEEGATPAQRQRLADAGRSGWPLGDAAWLAQLAPQVLRPVAPRPRGRPRRPA